MQNNQMIKQEFLQYIARLLETNPLVNHTHEGAARHDVAALLVEQVLELGTTEDNKKDLYVLKPLLRACILIISYRLNDINESDNYVPELPVIKKLKKEYEQTITTLEKILDNLN